MSRDVTRPDDRTVLSEDGTSATPGGAQVPRRETGLKPGDVLNGIYRVDRFIARGGMGDVYEGVNIESDERVAIKVMRSHLAEDPKVLSMFRKEAQVLTRIAHPAIVQYRVLAREPVLNLYYIVTDFIDGEPLSAHLDGTRPEVARIVAFGRRLASGLEVAHDHGAIHRDMSPDNILLPEGRLERAKIIDFGIAKSLDVTSETIVGDGFAGKLGYVAPEQFGDYGRDIGPWTDVYSMALVLLAFARGKAPDMGKTLSEAVLRRRDGPNMDGLPPVIEPLLRKMLEPDPKDRLRSMIDVIAELDRIQPEPVAEADSLPQPAPEPMAAETPLPAAQQTQTPATIFLPTPPPDAEARPIEPDRPASRRRGSSRLFVGSGVVLALALVAGLFLLLRGGEPASRPARPGSPAFVPPVPSDLARSPTILPGTAPSPQAVPPQAAALSPQATLLSAVGCTWLRAADGEAGAALRLRGGAGNVRGLGAAMADAARAKGVAVGGIDARDVVPIPASRCALVDALRGFDDQRDDVLSLLAPATHVAMAATAPGCPAGPAAQPTITIVEPDPARNFALFAMLPSGRLVPVILGRDQFMRRARRQPELFRDLGAGGFEFRACYRAAGPVGLILVDGTGPLPLGLPGGGSAPVSPDALQRLISSARAGGWRTRSAWLRIDPLPPAARPETVSSPGSATLPVAAAAPNTSSDPAMAPVPVETADNNGQVAACRRYDGKQWRELGYTTRGTCVERAFKNSCSIMSAFFGDTPLRRYNGHIEAQRKGEWSSVSRSDCR